MRRTSRRPRRITRRQQRGGTIESVKSLIQETPIPTINIVNPTSTFVVATYWWGRENINRNLQFPCPEDIMDMAREEALKEIQRTTPFPGWMIQTASNLKRTAQTRDLSEGERTMLQTLKTSWKQWKTDVLNKPENKVILQRYYNDIQLREQAKEGSRPPRTFPDMIAEWEGKCRQANVNYVSLNTEFPRSDYQNGINGKPLFIQKILDAVAPRGVLYIDGDMWINKYPAIFDIANVDFMARSWNMDPRSTPKSIEKPFYDPYTFETSGGTMYFGNTKRARELLDMWANASAKPEQQGKADDRILSQIFTTRSAIMNINTIPLPLEYLWLTDLYVDILALPNSPVSRDAILIEHPYCLTGEERASEQGANSNRTPRNYEEEVTDNIRYNRSPELFYEYIYFDGNEGMRQEFGRYLEYMKTAIGHFTQQPMLKIVDFANRYGEYNEIAKANLEGLSIASYSGQKVSLPLATPIRDILTHLLEGRDVELGGVVPTFQLEDEFVAKDGSRKEDGLDMYTRAVRIDTNAPMFLSAKSGIIKHLLAMCRTMEDVNLHTQTFLFLSRIRWNLYKDGNTSLKDATHPRILHQIWFGDEMPQWRREMFERNRKVCEMNGWTHRIWTNADRTPQNFPSTIEYQNTAIEIGKETGQSRWAQVADLARLELMYMHGGIYVDSLIETSPALLIAISQAFQQGFEFIGCNEDECDPPLDCIGNAGRKYLTNSFFASTQWNPILERLLDDTQLSQIDMNSEFINRTTGPYYLRTGIQEGDKVFMLKSKQIFQFNQQETPYKEATPDIFLFQEETSGTIKVRDDMYLLLGGLHILQTDFLIENAKNEDVLKASQLIATTIVEGGGPLATYHSGLGGTWST